MEKRNDFFRLSAFVIGAVLGLMVASYLVPVKAGNPSATRARYGQVVDADDQIDFFEGSVAAGASTTITIAIEQNKFSFQPFGGDAKIRFKDSATGRWQPRTTAYLTVYDQESIALPFELKTGDKVEIWFPIASGSFRYICTGRDDGLPEHVK